MNLIQRIQAPTPKAYKQVRNTGMGLAAIGAAILGAPVALPALVVKAAGYLAVAGSVASAISQTVTYEKPQKRRCAMEPNAYPNPSPKLGALGGTLLVIALHITREELLKTVVLAAIGATVSFAVSFLLQRLLRKKKR